MGVNLFYVRQPNQVLPSSTALWDSKIYCWKQKTDHRLTWFWSLAEMYKGRSGLLKVKGNFCSLEEMLVRWLKVGDIHPDSCQRTLEASSIRRTLSYLVLPLQQHELNAPIEPNWQFQRKGWVLPVHTVELATGFTCHFPAKCFDQEIVARAEMDLPDWIREIAYGHRRLSKEEIRKQMSNEPNVDQFPVSVLGTNYREGVQPITSLTHGSPRRLNLFDSVGETKKSKKHGCRVEDGYSYTLSVTHSPYYGGRNIQNFPGIADLKIHVWKKCWHHLSPISKLCPPNGAQVLYYFPQFKGKMNFHKDMNPAMVVSDEVNSQIMGSLVIVVSLFLSQRVSLAIRKDKRFHTVSKFFTEHGSVYILHPHDDYHFYHGTDFSETQAKSTNFESVRVAITFRWLGNRMSYLGDDYANPIRRHCQAVEDPASVIRESHKNRRDIADMFTAHL